jgi:hypothetical protein
MQETWVNYFSTVYRVPTSNQRTVNNKYHSEVMLWEKAKRYFIEEEVNPKS